MKTIDHAWHFDQDITACDLQTELSALEVGRSYTFGLYDTLHPENGKFFHGVLVHTITQPYFQDEKLVFTVQVTDKRGEQTKIRLEHHEGRWADSKLAFVI